nr:acyltransferase family protein [Petropleomorpha daqingensis]
MERPQDVDRPRPPASGDARPARSREVRVEIQALRALAMSLVVLYHVVPDRVPGGYVGVDVFFVVSGFLITSHLMREVRREGRIHLAQFWARRARRLLPAALLVLLVSAVAVFAFVPQTNWQGFLREIGGSALYVENWVLAGDAVNYLAADNLASPAQHYWSLSTEEQFYLVWPLLILAAVWLAARLRTRVSLVAGALGIVTVASFGYSLWATTYSPSSAYFATPARAWEFGLGGLLALLAASPLAGRDGVRAVVSWAGFGAIAFSALAFSAVTPFPGTAALWPVLGTVAVIWAGSPRGDWSPTKVADFGPVRFLGDVSYSAYLWHWPAVIILPYALGHDLGTRSKIGVLVFTVVAAWLTKVLVEDPVRTGTFLNRRRARVTFLATLLSTGLVVATAAGGWFYVQTRIDQARAAAAEFAGGGDPCFGAGAMDADRGCANPFAVTSTVDPAFAKDDLSSGMFCLTNDTSTELAPCRHDVAGSTGTVALIGDSHAASWWEAVQGLADDQRLSAVLYAHSGCPALSTDSFTGPRMDPAQPAACAEWSRDVIAAVAADPSVTTVFTTYRSDIYKYVTPDGSLVNQWPAPVVQSALQPLVDAGKKVYVIRALPTTNGVSPDGELGDREVPVPDCIGASHTTEDPCAGPRSERVTPDSIADGVQGMRGVQVLDLTDSFCDPRLCHAVIGGVVVYWDGSHITKTFSTSLAPFLTTAWLAHGGDGPGR